MDHPFIGPSIFVTKNPPFLPKNPEKNSTTRAPPLENRRRPQEWQHSKLDQHGMRVRPVPDSTFGVCWYVGFYMIHIYNRSHRKNMTHTYIYIVIYLFIYLYMLHIFKVIFENIENPKETKNRIRAYSQKVSSKNQRTEKRNGHMFLFLVFLGPLRFRYDIFLFR